MLVFLLLLLLAQIIFANFIIAIFGVDLHKWQPGGSLLLATIYLIVFLFFFYKFLLFIFHRFRRILLLAFCGSFAWTTNLTTSWREPRLIGGSLPAQRPILQHQQKQQREPLSKQMPVNNLYKITQLLSHFRELVLFYLWQIDRNYFFPIFCGRRFLATFCIFFWSGFQLLLQFNLWLRR